MEVTVMPAAAPVQKQQGLNQVVINKVQKMIEGKQQGVMASACCTTLFFSYTLMGVYV